MSKREQFIELWAEYLQEHEKLGGDVKATSRSLLFFLSVFDQYESGAIRGVAIVEPGVGVFLCGELGDMKYDVVEDDRAYVLGTYVVPEQRRAGVAKRMRNAAIEKLRDIGIRSLEATVLASDPIAEASMRSAGYTVTGLHGILEVN